MWYRIFWFCDDPRYVFAGVLSLSVLEPRNLSSRYVTPLTCSMYPLGSTTPKWSTLPSQGLTWKSHKHNSACTWEDVAKHQTCTHHRKELTNGHSVLTALLPSFKCLVNNFNRLGYSPMSSIRASFMLHPKAHTYNPKIGRRHHLGSSFEVMLPHVRESVRAGSCRKRASCRVYPATVICTCTIKRRLRLRVTVHMTNSWDNTSVYIPVHKGTLLTN